jgi:pyridoxine 4-dehydrogenase
MSKYVKVAAVEIEVSLWSFEKDIRDTLDWCNTNKVPVYAYSPLGRGFITKAYSSPDGIPDGDFKRTMPKFQGEAFYENLKLIDQLDEFAKARDLKMSQLAIAWVCSLNPYVSLSRSPICLFSKECGEEGA